MRCAQRCWSCAGSEGFSAAALFQKPVGELGATEGDLDVVAVLGVDLGDGGAVDDELTQGHMRPGATVDGDVLPASALEGDALHHPVLSGKTVELAFVEAAVGPL